jgi:hypothetical protein
MADLTAPVNYKVSDSPFVEDFPCSSLSVKAGALIGIDESTGYAVTWADTDGTKLLGRAVETTTSASTVKVYTGKHTVHGASDALGVAVAGCTAVTNNGDLVYCSTNNLANCTLTPGNEPIGRVSRYISSGKAWVEIIPRGYSLGSPSAFDGPVDLGSTLNVAGATTLESTLAVTGASTFTGATAHNGGLTTTRGVASGTALKVGGQASSAVAASTAVTNTAVETAFDNSSYAVPADTLTQGSRLKIFAQGIATSTTGSDTLEIIVYAGSTELFSTGALDVGDNEAFSFIGEVVARAAPAAAASCVGFAHIAYGTDEEASVGKHSIMPATNLATNGALTFNVRAKWSAANAGNSCRLDICNYEVIG